MRHLVALAAVGESGLAMDRILPSSFAVGPLKVKRFASFQRLNSSMQSKSLAAIAAPTRQVQQHFEVIMGLICSKYHRRRLPSSKE